MTNAELAILSLVAEEPRHGYEIEQIIEGRGMREWTEIGFSSIYYLLKKLEGQGLVAGHLEEAERGPARKVYQATPAGREALREGVLNALSVPTRCYPPLQLGLANLPLLAAEEVAAALAQYQAALAERLAHIEARQAEQQPLPYFVDAMFEYSQAMIRAEMAWVEEFIREVEKQNTEG